MFVFITSVSHKVYIPRQHKYTYKTAPTEFGSKTIKEITCLFLEAFLGSDGQGQNEKAVICV